jgi:hypothetical protein
VATPPQVPGAAMLDTCGSDVVVGLFALLFGAAFRTFALVVPRPPTDRREGETMWEAARRHAEEGARPWPRSEILAVLAVYGLLAVIVLTIVFSGVEMRWLAFAVGTALGAGAIEAVFRHAQRGAARPAAPPPSLPGE